jgi:hypothetical protein
MSDGTPLTPPPIGVRDGGMDATPPAGAGDGGGDKDKTDINAFGIVVLASIFVALAVLLIIAIVQLWPAAGSTAGTFVTGHRIFGYGADFNLDDNFIVLAILVGALGAILHCVRSIAWYVGEGKLKRIWILYYVTLPVVGSMLAVFVYWLIRGGLISTSASTKDVNPYGIASIAGLVGLFSEQAAQMLLNTFTSIFTKAPKGSNSAPQANQ